ncbi:MAG: hypothetical protein COY58_01370 [Gammaproteobacteria bacterium CG_4_10_14_0_8_um_filter_38_16]|nr:MAG: hypothetical protein COY58_01370 [Gammaproteobacteria bacterium CG_4_10_14_0_8_um_filter_38_16]PJA03506.1 MAG: hypothetical protein COX72_04615 [Gammaproteobacteria bacterium CG_4_10_14_0_2_um_filter_38_22]PJB10272.1 MAG: hypothetical protein CO120_05760 [Gammaproteobacteria bacterium CG_4_9_14_3_um_filter_38_9]
MSNIRYLVQHHLINAVYKNPEKIALIIDDKSYSYKTIYRDCLIFRAHFISKAIARGDRIIIRSGSAYLTVIAFWSSLMCDAVPCIVDPEIASSAFEKINTNIDPFLIITHESIIQNEKILDNNNVFFKNTENDLAMIMHTSGSTGDAKGVMLSHRNVMAAIESIRFYLGLNEKDVILSVLPMHFDYGLYQMLLAFSLGATLVLEKNALFPNFIANRIQQYQVTVLPCVPLLVQIFYIAFKKYQYDFDSIRIVTNTGENLSLGHIHKLKQLFPKSEIFSMYGLTECKRCSYVPPDNLAEKSSSIGMPMPNIEMWVQDEKGNTLGANLEGELVVSGPTVMQGYWKNKLATEKKIHFFGDKRILLTGDRAVMDEDGFFYFKGRRDLIFKFKGAKFNTQEYVLKVLSLSEVDRCYIFLDKTNLSESKLIVCVELAGVKKNYDSLRKLIYAFFPSTQKPTFIYFFNQFPALSNGKLDKCQLEEIAKMEAQCI